MAVISGNIFFSGSMFSCNCNQIYLGLNWSNSQNFEWNRLIRGLGWYRVLFRRVSLRTGEFVLVE